MGTSDYDSKFIDFDNLAFAKNIPEMDNDVRMGDPAGDADAGPSVEPAPGGLNLDTSSWEGALNSFLLWAAREPYTFLLYVLIGLSPFLCISAILSYKLSKELKKQDGRRGDARGSQRRRRKSEKTP